MARRLRDREMRYSKRRIRCPTFFSFSFSFALRPTVLFYARGIRDATTNKCLSIRYAFSTYTFMPEGRALSHLKPYATRRGVRSRIRVVGRSSEWGRVWKGKARTERQESERKGPASGVGKGRGGGEREGKRRVQSSFRRDGNKEQFIFGGHMCWLFRQFARPS